MFFFQFVYYDYETQQIKKRRKKIKLYLYSKKSTHDKKRIFTSQSIKNKIRVYFNSNFNYKSNYRFYNTITKTLKTTL